jgi:phosphohistidine phosphatase
MQLYILRHAIAVPRGTPGYPGDDRPLTEEGIAKMIEGAKGIKEIAGAFDLIVTSPLIRAYDTAKITAEVLRYENHIITTDYLLPGSPQRSLIKFLADYNHLEKILLVGHEPHLGYFASRLLGSDEMIVEFKKGGICRIDIEELPVEKPGKLIFSTQPKQLRLIANTLSKEETNPAGND